MSRDAISVTRCNLSTCISNGSQVKLSIVLFLSSIIQINIAETVSNRTTAIERSAFNATLEQEIIGKLDLEVSPVQESLPWLSAFWAMGMSHRKTPETLAIVNAGFNYYHTADEDFKRALLEAAFTLFPEQFSEQIINLLHHETNTKLIAMQAIYLRRAGVVYNWEDVIAEKRLGNSDDIILNRLVVYLERTTQGAIRKRPPIDALFNHQASHGKPVIYSFQRGSREYPGLAIVQHADGSFARHANGVLKTFPQLAMAASNMPSFLTHGNTPEGVYSIHGIGSSENVFIGPTPTITMQMPYEAEVARFFHNGKINIEWSLSHYLTLFPHTWRHYEPIQDTYWAGKAGRTEIIAHGTTINPEFFTGTSFYPFTPSLGCVTGLELWNSETGMREQSSQSDLVSAFNNTGHSNGYFYLISLDDKEAAVSIDDLQSHSEQLMTSKSTDDVLNY